MDMLTITPALIAQENFNSVELVFNPYASGSLEHREYADELLRLATERGNDDERI